MAPNFPGCRRNNAKGDAARGQQLFENVGCQGCHVSEVGAEPTNSTIMMDVQWHWTNLWWAGKKRNWPLAQYYFNESRGHIQQLVRKNPTIRNQVDNTDVELQGIFDGIDTSSLAMVKDAIAKKDALAFEKNYRTMLESCYSCHKSIGRPYIRPQIPTAQVQAMVNMDPNATWPQ